MTTSPLVRALATATDIGSFNRARLDLQRFGTPSEVREVLRLLPSHPLYVAAAFVKLSDYCFWEKPEPEPFERVVDEPEWSLYRGVGDPSGRELVIGLAGGMGNLNHGSATILQQLDARRHDLLLLRDLKRSSYTDGVAGTRSFDEMVELLAEAAAPYRSCLVMGASMGGGPALEVGIALGARRAIALCGGPRADLTVDRDPTQLLTELWVVYSADNVADTAKAAQLRELYPSARLLAVPDARLHNVTRETFYAGTMTPLFELLLSSSGTAERTIGTAPPDGRTLLQLVPTCEPPDWTRPPRPRRFGRSSVARLLSRLPRAVRPSRRT